MNKTPDVEKLLANAARDISGAFAARLCTLGIALGLFKAISQSEGVTSKELAEYTNFAERYLREWMYGVALAGYIEFYKTSRKGSLSPDR